MIYTILICSVLLIITIYLITLFHKIEFNRNTNTLQPFSSDIRFDPFPQQIDITNPYECSGTDLRPCKLDDNLSCIGCQSLLARCTHFEQDTKYFDDDGNVHIIPANKDPNDGYCMTISNSDLNVSCNLYHGDLALIKITPESNESMFFCNCKNPGFIGNTSILGACDTPFICNGKVDNINQNLEDINCVCSPTQHSIRTEQNNVPMCVDMTVREANNRNTLRDVIINNEDLIDIKIFNPIIRSNLNNVDKLLHPCKFCPLTNQYISNGILGKIKNDTFCSIHLDRPNERNEYFGIPYRRSRTERILEGDEDTPDCVLGVYWHEVMIYEHLLPDQKQIVLFAIEHHSNEEFYIALNLDFAKTYWIKTENINVGLHIPIPRIDFTTVPGTSCWERWPNYHCSFSAFETSSNTQPAIQINTALEYLAPNTNVMRQPQFIDRPSGPFLTNLDSWRQMQQFNRAYTIANKFSDTNEYLYFTLDAFNSGGRTQSRFAQDVRTMTWGYRRKGINALLGWELTMYSNHDRNDWELLNNRLIPFV